MSILAVPDKTLAGTILLTWSTNKTLESENTLPVKLPVLVTSMVRAPSVNSLLVITSGLLFRSL